MPSRAESGSSAQLSDSNFNLFYFTNSLNMFQVSTSRSLQPVKFWRKNMTNERAAMLWKQLMCQSRFYIKGHSHRSSRRRWQCPYSSWKCDQLMISFFFFLFLFIIYFRKFQVFFQCFYILQQVTSYSTRCTRWTTTRPRRSPRRRSGSWSSSLR